MSVLLSTTGHHGSTALSISQIIENLSCLCSTAYSQPGFEKINERTKACDVLYGRCVSAIANIALREGAYTHDLVIAANDVLILHFNGGMRIGFAVDRMRAKGALALKDTRCPRN